MNIDELLQLLEIYACEEFTFFEYYAELVENESEIPFETLRELLLHTDKKILAELTEGYFEETLSAVPDDQTEFYALLDAIGRNMTHLAKFVGEDRGLDIYAEELLRFKQWYTLEGVVHCDNKDSREMSDVTICEALTLSRLEKLGESEYFFEFGDSMDYPLDAYAYTFDSLADAANGYEDDADDEDDYDDEPEALSMLPDDYIHREDVYDDVKYFSTYSTSEGVSTYAPPLY
jgi:hypothetical protein